MFKFFIVLLLVGGALGYWYWTTTPQYSVLKLHEAIKSHDLYAFHKYADVDSIASRMVDDLLTKPVQNALGPGIVGQLLGFGLGVFVKPALVASMKEEINHYVEGQPAGPSSFLFEPAVRPVSNGVFQSIPGQLGFTGKVFNKIEYVRTEGKISLVGLSLHNTKYASDLVLELKMRDAGGYWCLVELSNLQDFMGKIFNLQMQNSKQTESMDLAPLWRPSLAFTSCA